MRPPSIQLLRALQATEFFPIPSRIHQRPLVQQKILSTATCPKFSRARHLAINSIQRTFSTVHPFRDPASPRTTDRGPASKEDTQTDFSSLNVLGNLPAPASAIDACLPNGFHLDNGLKIANGSGCLLVGGEVFTWRPWQRGPTGNPNQAEKSGAMVNRNGELEVPKEAWGILELVWPKPDLLILGTGGRMRQVSRKTREVVGQWGVRLDVSDTRNAAAQFNLLATERGVGQVAAALVPVGC
ncbi:MAG: hypothetical protein Q9214_004011 [Letrouitia sp. 1 TL-2023]